MNYYLLFGCGSVELKLFVEFVVFFVFEIGGLFFSGGYGFDIDEVFVVLWVRFVNVV